MNNSLVSMGRLKPGLWAVAIVFISMRPSELYVSPHPFAEEFDKWITVTVNFTTGHEVPRSHHVSDAIALEAVRFKDVLPISKAVFAFKCIWVVVGAHGWFLRWAEGIAYVVALELGSYLARVGKDLKRDFEQGLVRASEDFPGIGLATGPLRDVPMVEANALDSWNVPATVEDNAQMSLEPDIAEEAEGLMDYRTAEACALPAAALDDEQVPEANLDTLWEELLGAGLVTGQSGDTPQVEKGLTDPWGVPATAEKARVSPGQTIAGQSEEPIPVPEVNIHELWVSALVAGLVTEPLGGAPNVAMNITDPRGVPATVGGVQTLLSPATLGESQGCHPQVLLQQEGVIHQMGSPAIATSQRTVPQSSLDKLWANLQLAGRTAEQSGIVQRAEVPGLDSTYSQRRSPPYQNPIAELTRYLVNGSGNGGSAPGEFTLSAQEQALGNSLQGGVKTEGVGSVKFGGKWRRLSYLEMDLTQEEIPPPVTDTFNSMPSSQQSGEASAIMPSTRVNQGLFRFTKLGWEISGSETDEEGKIYWADSMPEKLRTLHGHYTQAPEAQTSSD
ncbi:hypothetical protein HOY82DRAFT_540742 [Tuber indicum]|nr:hypothetical protein HOY82DRAFT_540742 [Tuber indicum]